jgi:hypothetical protein
MLATMLNRALILVMLLAFATPAFSQAAESGIDTATDLLVVLRESIGANKQDETLVPSGKTTATLPNGNAVELSAAWYEYLGDMQIRFVFGGPQSMRNATPKDLERLRLTPQEALRVSVANLKRIYGEPTSTPWDDDLTEVHGKSPELGSSYFLDREFWRGLLKQHASGVVVAAPKRGALLYAPLSDTKAVESLRRNAGYLYASGGSQRVSSALYLFKEDKWTVFQPAAPR